MRIPGRGGETATRGGRSQDEEETIRRGTDWRVARQFARFTVPPILLAALLSLAGAALDLAGPLIVKAILDGPMPRGDMPAIARLIGLFFLVIAAGFVFEAAVMLVVNWTGQTAMMRLRERIFRRLQSLDTRFFDKNPVGRLLTRVMNDVAALNEALTMGIPTIFRDLLVLAGIVALLFRIDAPLARAVFLCFPLILAIGWLFSRAVRVYYRQTRARIAALNAFLQESLSGMRVVQLFGREPKHRRQFAELNARHRDSMMGTVFAFALFFPAIEMAGALSLALILWQGGERLAVGGISFGVLTAFVLYTRRFLTPIRDLAEKFNTFEAAMAAAERVFGLLDIQPEMESPAAPAPARPFASRIEFEHVWFAYEGEEWALRDVGFTVERGQTVAIVGATGAGKTTIISLLQRLYDPQKGRITIDGTDIRAMALKDLRGRLALVPQDVFLFRGSILENIRIAKPGLSEEEARRAAEIVHADSFIRALPNGYDQEILERGATLSTGQKQLLAFARALARAPEILILDEATSNIDTETERLIQDALRRLTEGRTAIVVAHRLSTIRQADKIIALQHGRVREQGTHEDLLRRRGYYWNLCRLQYREALPPGASIQRDAADAPAVP